jgi:TPR repeat protein
MKTIRQTALLTAFVLSWNFASFAQSEKTTSNDKAVLTTKTAATYEESQTFIDAVYGDNAPQDFWLTLMLLRDNAEQGDASSQSCLGSLYEKGQGVPQDSTQSAVWFRKAAEQGNAEAQSNLGFLYDNGRGVPQDYVQASAWFRKAAEQGNSGAQSNLGILYENGRGVEKDYSKAYFWISIGLAGYTGDSQRRDSLEAARAEAAKHLTPSKLTTTQQQASEWFEKRKAAKATR